MTRRVLNIPPDISVTTASNAVGTRFTDETAMSTAAYSFSPNVLRYVQLPPDWRGEPFEKIAQTKPAYLLQLITQNRLAAHDLTFAAESAGKVPNEFVDASVRVLLVLLRHESPLVREGAIYGLSRQLARGGWVPCREWIIDQLEGLKERDTSPGVRAAAQEALSDVTG